MVNDEKYSELLLEKKLTDAALSAQIDTFFLFEISTGKAVRWNDSFSRVTGYKDNEIKELLAPQSYYSPEDIEKANQCIHDVLNKGMGTVEMDLICKDGRTVPFEYRVSAINDENNEPQYMISIGRDVTERKKINFQYKLTIDNLRAGVIVHRGSDTSIIISNSEAHRLLGLSLDEMNGKKATDPAWNFLHEDLRIMKVEDYPVNIVLKTKQVLTDYVVGINIPGKKKKTWVTVTAVPIFSQDGSMEKIIVNFVDITKRKEIETSYIKTKNYLKNIIDSMPIMLIGVNIDGLITQWNQKAQSTTGIKLTEAIDRPLNEVLPYLSKDMEMIIASIKTGKRQSNLRRVRRFKENTIFEDMTIFPLIYNEVQGAVLLIEDVTEKIRIEEMIVQSEKMMFRMKLIIPWRESSRLPKSCPTGYIKK
ncbi:MAG: PAS domain-containing protein [Spirochaetaceae bacterium]|nr:PAS domain-containing protein [Spirochaetaceae bacterium]